MIASEPAAAANSQFIFITGLHRSGTSLLRDLLASRPGVRTLRAPEAVEDEGQFLQDVLPLPVTFGGPGRFAWQPDARFTELDLARLPNAADRMCRSWAPHWSGDGDFFIEKSPANVMRGRFLRAAFPNSKVIVVVRHPVPVAYATRKWARLDVLRSKPWARVPVAQLMRHWVRANIAAAIDVAMMGDAGLLVRYEDLVREPLATLNAIQAFGGMQPLAIDTSAVRAAGNDRYFVRWHERLSSTGYLERRLLQPIAKQAACFGYDLFEN